MRRYAPGDALGPLSKFASTTEDGMSCRRATFAVKMKRGRLSIVKRRTSTSFSPLRKMILRVYNHGIGLGVDRVVKLSDGFKPRHGNDFNISKFVAAKLAPHYPVLYRSVAGLVAHECILNVREIKTRSGISRTKTSRSGSSTTASCADDVPSRARR